jgi:hypothetical protein
VADPNAWLNVAKPYGASGLNAKNYHSLRKTNREYIKRHRSNSNVNKVITNTRRFILDMRERIKRAKNIANEERKGVGSIKHTVNVGRKFGTLKSEIQRRKNDTNDKKNDNPNASEKLSLIEKRRRNATEKSKPKGTTMNLDQEAYLKLLKNDNKDAQKELEKLAIKETPKEKKLRMKREAQATKNDNHIAFEKLMKKRRYENSAPGILGRMLRGEKAENEKTDNQGPPRSGAAILGSFLNEKVGNLAKRMKLRSGKTLGSPTPSKVSPRKPDKKSEK